MATTHQTAIRLWNIYAPAKRTRKATIRAVMQRTVAEAARKSAESETAHLSRDFRPGIGSGRAAHWCAPTYRHYTIASKTIHRECGFRNDECRRIARVIGMTELRAADLDSLPPCPIDPQHWGYYSEDFERRLCAEHGEHAARWMLFRRWVIGRAWAEADAAQTLARCADPTYRISGYLAASVIYWQTEGKQGSSYAGCSGCESYHWLREHPEHWELLLSRAPVGAKGDDWEQVFPHELERAADLRARGWHETFRMNDSLWSLKHPVLTHCGIAYGETY